MKPTARAVYTQLYDSSVPDWPGEVNFYQTLITRANSKGIDVLEIACGTDQPGYIDKIWDDYLLIELLPCTHCSPSPLRETIILNGITGAIKELGGGISESVVNNSVWHRHLSPIEVPCDPGEGCGDGFYTDYEPSGEYFSEPLP